MASGDSEIDPRYAAQFQRGFDGTTVGPLETADRAEPVHLGGGRPASAPRVVAHPGPAPATPRVAAVEAHAVASGEAAAEERPAWPERVLFGGGGVLVFVAVWLFAQALASATSSRSPADAAEALWMWAQWALPGPALVGGVVALCGGLVLGALRTRRPG